MRSDLPALRALPSNAPVREVASALDLDVPGWEDRIELAALDMADCRLCIAGQVFKRIREPAPFDRAGSVRDGYDRLSDRLMRVGGWMPHAFGGDGSLRTAWVAAIRARRRRKASA